MGEISLKLNGKLETKDVADNTLLIDFIREHVGLLDGVSVKACTMLAKQAEGSEIVTIEGLADGDELHPMQQAFHENHGLQCGFCTPGMVMSAVEMVTKNKNISEDEIRKGLEGNICRCTGYHNIVQSVKAGAAKMGG